MWSTVAMIANHNGFPEADLVEFAISRNVKYGIMVIDGDAKIDNCLVSSLLNDFEAFLAEEDAAEVEYLLQQNPEFAPVDVGCEFDPKF
jgi:hypothetical protein